MKSKLFIRLVLTGLILSAKISFGQNPAVSFEHLTSEEGLPNSTILDILQDKKGFMWFASRNGLCRYDGYNFTSFKADGTNERSISDNWISCLFEDNEGILYVGTWDQGFYIYNSKRDNFTAYKAKNNVSSIGSDKIRCIKEDDKGIIWIGTADNGFFSFNKRQNEFSSFSMPAECLNNCNDMAIGKDGNLWMITTMLELVQFSPVTKEFIVINKSLSNKQKSEEILSKLLIDKNGNLWIGTNTDGLYYSDLKSNTTRHWLNDINNPESLNSNNVSDIQDTNDGKLWIATDGGGIDILDVEKGEFYHNTNNLYDPNSLNTNAIYCLYSDRNNNVWAGTYLRGINIFNPNRNKFANYKPASNNLTGLSSNSVLAIFQDRDNDMLIGTDGGGLFLFNKEKYGEKFIDFRTAGNNKKNLCPEVVKTICQTNDGIIWIGTWNKGLVKFDKKKNIFSYMGWDERNPEKLSGPVVWSVMEVNKDQLWIGVWPFGIDIFDRRTNKVVKQIRQSNGFHGKYPSHIFKDSKGRIWVATYDEGLNRYIDSSGTFVNYRYDSNNLMSLSSNQLSTIFEDSRGNIWIGTIGSGLNKYNETTDDFSAIDETNGLTSNEINGILEDKNGDFWISSNRGVLKFSPTTYKTRIYDRNDGLQGNEFNECASFKDKDGRFYFGGTRGFNSFYPEQIRVDSSHTPLYFTSLSIFNKLITVNSPDSVLSRSIIETKEITLPYKKSVFTFEFTALNYNYSKNNQYSFRMENFEDNWNDVGKKRYATYTNLDPGDYTFMVKATNNDGIWNEVPTTIKITISPPYWKTWWFRISWVLFITGSIVFTFIWRTRQLKKQKKLLEIKVSERTIELKDTNAKLEERQEQILQQSEELKATLNQLSQAQNQLIQSEKMASLGILAAGVAHEINNPLNFIQGGITAVDTYFKENLQNHIENVSPMIDGIQVGVSRAAAIVTSLNHYSRPDNEKKTECNIHELIDNCLVVLHNQMRNRIEIHKNYSIEPLIIAANENKLHQAMLNILANSVQAIESEGTLSISTKLENNIIKITIEDSGCGISDEDLSKIFDPFFTTKDPGKGAGLGLSISYYVIKEHGGNIEFNSIPGKGTKAIINLPPGEKFKSK